MYVGSEGGAVPSSAVETEVGAPVATVKLKVCGVLPPAYVTVNAKSIVAAHGNVDESVKKYGAEFGLPVEAAMSG